MICKYIAKNNDYIFLRLDCLATNKKLNEIYEKHGFTLNRTGCCNYYNYALREYDLLNDVLPQN